LLDGLLAYSRFGRTKTAIEDVDIAEVVQDIVAMLAPPPGLALPTTTTATSAHQVAL
jgi:light-regulated signal transduction histidine kinase (bacteriophytochrome)